MTSTLRTLPAFRKFLFLLLTASLTAFAAAGGSGKKPKSEVFPGIPEVLNPDGDLTLRYPVMRFSGKTLHSISYGWFDVSRTRVRYTVVQPERNASDAFDLPIDYIADPQVIKLAGGYTPIVMKFYGGVAGGDKKENMFIYLPQDRWGTVHTTTGMQAASRRGILGMLSMVGALKSFDQVVGTLRNKN
jgi:hypothetical protein